jgi:hypothetical protein
MTYLVLAGSCLIMSAVTYSQGWPVICGVNLASALFLVAGLIKHEPPPIETEPPPIETEPCPEWRVIRCGPGRDLLVRGRTLDPR